MRSTLILFILVFVMSIIISPRNQVETKGARGLTHFTWWKQVKPAKAKSRFSYHKRPPNLLAPGILHFKSPSSHKYYFHKQVIPEFLYFTENQCLELLNFVFVDELKLGIAKFCLQITQPRKSHFVLARCDLAEFS